MTLKPIGQYWEQRAEHFLLQKGLQLIARNFSNSSGEIDLIMRDGGSGRCKALLNPPGVSERDARKLRSMTCSYKSEIF